ncbi:hypothetical protein AGMMS50218_00120 [Actinomycetota bacterium]|nr:hypothetical protein AGMMS50218_00120 [Actinomycetota bacterium]
MGPARPDTDRDVNPLLPGRRGTRPRAVLLAAALALTVLAGGCDSHPGNPEPQPVPDGSAPAPAPPGPGSAAGQVAAGDLTGDLPSLDLTTYSHTDPASPWVVVNKAVPLDPVDHEPDLAQVRGYLVQPVVVDDLTALLAAADDDGVHLTLRSAYRSYGYQVGVYDGWVRQLGREQADQVSARPGHSEHQTGLAVDLGGSTRPECDFEACFGDTVEGQWVAAHAEDFGFLLRYTEEDTAVTGFAPEGWHVRYVGRELAAYLRGRGIDTLEGVFDVPGGADYG